MYCKINCLVDDLALFRDIPVQNNRMVIEKKQKHKESQGVLTFAGLS